MNAAAFILAMVAPIIIRCIVALGFTAVTFTGVSALSQGLVTYAQSSWASIPLTILQLSSLSGVPEFLGMVFGAFVARVLMWASLGASKYVLKT